MDPELLPGSGSGIIVPDPNSAKMKEQIKKYLIFNFRPLNSGLCRLQDDCTLYNDLENSRFFFLIKFKVYF